MAVAAAAAEEVSTVHGHVGLWSPDRSRNWPYWAQSHGAYIGTLGLKEWK